jgi:hypothetical protein
LSQPFLSDIQSTCSPEAILILPSLTSSSRIGFRSAYLIPVAARNLLRSILPHCWPVSRGYDHAETVKGLPFQEGFLLDRTKYTSINGYILAKGRDFAQYLPFLCHRMRGDATPQSAGNCPFAYRVLDLLSRVDRKSDISITGNYYLAAHIAVGLG